MSTETKTFESIRKLRDALPSLPDDAVILDRDGDKVRRSDVHIVLGNYAPYTVRYESTTPAPLDPSKVTLMQVSATHLQPGDVIVNRLEGVPDGYAINRPQPAPEPEPEWKPGTVGMAMVSGKANVRVMRVLPGVGVPVVRPWVSDHPIGGWLAHTDPEVADFVPDEPRPLPTRDELVKAMHDDYLRDGEPRLTVTAREHLADAVLTFLRGESR